MRAIKDDLLMIYGKATTTAQIDYLTIANELLKEVGYKKPFRILQQISKQSPDINQAVVQEELRANDQGIVYGYATNETRELMPLPVLIAHKLMKCYEEVRKIRTDFFADAKSQVSVEYGEDGKPKAITTVLISASHAENLTQEIITEIITETVIKPPMWRYRRNKARANWRRR